MNQERGEPRKGESGGEGLKKKEMARRDANRRIGKHQDEGPRAEGLAKECQTQEQLDRGV